jgi:hypothetical protein
MYQQMISPEANQYHTSQSLEAVANRLYDSVKGNTLLAGLKKLFGKDGSGKLLTLDEVTRQTHIHGHKAIGVKTVDMDQILGTIAGGRSQDFDNDFHPLQEHNKERWLGVAAAWISGRRLGPVKLVQVGNIFFVEDGHHRVSVAKALGEQEIEAEVVILMGASLMSVPAPQEGAKRAGRFVLQPAKV